MTLMKPHHQQWTQSPQVREVFDILREMMGISHNLQTIQTNIKE